MEAERSSTCWFTECQKGIFLLSAGSLPHVHTAFIWSKLGTRNFFQVLIMGGRGLSHLYCLPHTLAGSVTECREARTHASLLI